MGSTVRAEGRVLTFVGDVMLGRLMNDVLETMGPVYPWGDTLPLLRSADLTIINLECVISDRGRPWQRTPKVFHFRAGPLALDALNVAGVDVVSLANNHVLDFEEEALVDMLERLRTRGIRYTGAGRDRAEAMRPAFADARGLRVAVIALTDNEPDWAAGATRPGTHYVPISTAPLVHRHVASCIAHARQHADFVVVSAHWGPNMVLRPPPHHRAFAHMVLDAGADLFYGHSAHVFQGIEWYQGKPILYDTGDFVDDYAVDPVLRNDWALCFRVFVAPGQTGAGETGGWRVVQLDLVPLLIQDFQVNQAHGADYDGIVQRATMLCAEFGTRLKRRDQHLMVTPPAVARRRAAAGG